MSAVSLPAAVSASSRAAISARISPFTLAGRAGVCSVMGPSTRPYRYTLSRKIRRASFSRQAVMTLPMMSGHCALQTRRS